MRYFSNGPHSCYLSGMKYSDGNIVYVQGLAWRRGVGSLSGSP